jgi:hypothetical protein
MTDLRNSLAIVDAFFIFSMVALITLYQQQQQQQQQPHFAYAGGTCINYDQTNSTITIICNTSFRDVADTLKDQSVLSNLGGSGDYILKANLQVNDGATLLMGPNDGIKWLKIAGANGIIVNGAIQIEGIKITSWDPSTNNVVPQNTTGSIKRAYIQFGASEGSKITNSEFAYLGYNELGRRGLDLFGGGGPSHDIDIRGSKFHHMWFGFYSTGAYNITIDRNEFYDNIKYSVDSHSGTHNITITNNWVHHNRIGIICSVDCYDILIEGNRIFDNTKAGIFFSRGMQHSIARSNYIYNTSSGIILSESPDNIVYNNTIEGAKSEGILLFNPAIPDEGLTQNNHIYNNTISISANGINSSRSQNNILTDNKFTNITSSEYLLTRNSTVLITNQDFDNASIRAGNGSPVGNIVGIEYSGPIEVVEQNDQGMTERNYYNTNNAPLTKVLSHSLVVTTEDEDL